MYGSLATVNVTETASSSNDVGTKAAKVAAKAATKAAAKVAAAGKAAQAPEVSEDVVDKRPTKMQRLPSGQTSHAGAASKKAKLDKLCKGISITVAEVSLIKPKFSDVDAYIAMRLPQVTSLIAKMKDWI